ncbi:hypothetical protein D8B26_006409 [Coccidioides posadasii str. Silveira]|uniref:RNase3 domain-containing protein n=2 Tax=Coccidioides posadasii TaxID=199306 RepID=E9CT24_COCPS|nr:RNase3 domain-containing protein [Coccidioides posadasii str. Silveira]KMM67367.1 double-strand-specific pac1 ribonuclease [Coccidioides posadasii RMSCC 3488]QVM11763.1 hypothetical protein D8B26_006409 [Coccidioides posadasii str. Silveira]
MKRKSEDVEGKDALKPTKEKKRKKHRHRSHGSESENSAPRIASTGVESTVSKGKSISKSDGEKLKKETIKSHLEQLERITHDIASDPESIREYIGNGASIEIISAAAELARAFARSKLSSEQPSEPKEQPNAPSSFEAPPIKDKTLETAVFTHQGEVHAQAPSAVHSSYDRLEILGDAYLEVIATRLIWDRFQTLPAGRMSQIRELLVKNETLAQFSERYGFDRRVKIASDIRSQAKRWMKVKGDIFEAYVAAVILSDPVNGFNLVEEWLAYLWIPTLNHVQPENQAAHYKETLAKKVMGKGIKLRYINESPPINRKGGMQTFFIGVYLTGWGWQDQHLGSGSGLNKAAAGNAAAKQAVENHPLIDEIHAVKKSFDEKVKAEREKAVSAD